MTTPTIRAALDTFQQAANRGTAVYLSPELVQELRAALKAEPEGEGEGPSERIISIAKAVQECAFTHEPDARLIGNVCAEDVADLCTAALATPPAPVPREVEEVAQWLLSMRELAGEHNPEERRQFTRAATLLQRLASPACLVVDRLPEGLLDLLKSEPGRIEACTAGVSIEPLGDAPRPTSLDAIRLAQGCHDYSGGHTGAEGEAWHSAIDTVVEVLRRAAIGPWDSQTRAVYGVGAEAQAGEVEELVALLKIAGRWATSTGVHLDRFAALFDQQAAELAALRGVPVAASERLRIVRAGIRAGYNLGHHHTVEGGWGDPDEVADDIAQETLDDIGLPPAPQCLIARMADELDRLQPLPAFPPITSHPLAIEARALLRGGIATIPDPQAGEVEELVPVSKLDDQHREAPHPSTLTPDPQC